MKTFLSRLFKLLGIVILVFILYVVYINFLRPVRLKEISLTDLSGHHIDFDSLIQDKHTILNFWATWCKPCIEEMPMLDSVYQQLDKEQWRLLLVSDEPIEVINAFKASKNFSMMFLRHAQPLSTIGVSALPKTVIVDEHRKVLYLKTGAITMSATDFLTKVKEHQARGG